MSMPLSPALESPGPSSSNKKRRRRRLALIAAVVAVVVVGGGLALTDPFAGNGTNNAANAVNDNTYPTTTTTVQREPLQSQTEVQGTLGYASGSDDATATDIVLPAGTATSTLQQAEQEVTAAKATLASDEAALGVNSDSNAQSLAQADQQVWQRSRRPWPPTRRRSGSTLTVTPSRWPRLISR